MHTYESSDGQENMKTNLKAKQALSTQDEVKKILKSHSTNDPYLDLSGRSIHSIPVELFMLPHIQHLYLEGNFLTELPENFFDRLPALIWLDLRNNKLSSLPSSIGRHQCIKNLLLEGNNLSHLPLQMGTTKTLSGLNLRGNPLQSPPQHIVDQGVYVILSYLYQELQNRMKEPEEEVLRTVEKLNISEDTTSTSEDEILTEAINITGGRNIPSPMSDDFELVRHGPTPISASLHKPVSYQEYKGRFQANSLVEGLRNKSRNGRKELSLFDLKQQEDSRKEQLRAMMERQTAHADQRRKDRTVLESWRLETRRRQRSFPRAKTEIDIKPPYGIDLNPIEFHQNVREEKVECVMPSERLSEKETKHNNLTKRSHMIVEIPNAVNEQKQVRERNESEKETETDKATGEVISNKIVQPNSVVKKNEAVQERIKQHSSQIRHRLKQIKHEGKQVERSSRSKELQRQLLEEKISKSSQLEYRFRAFTGDTVSLNSSSNKTGSIY